MLTHFQYFSDSIKEYKLPIKFTFPFYYEPHPLCQLAAKEVQQYLSTQTDFIHNFGLSANSNGTVAGKMFGVLIVQNTEGKIGYIAAVSGKLGEKNNHKMFVPPVYDMLHNDAYFLEEKKKLNHINSTIENLQSDTTYKKLLHKYTTESKKATTDIKEKKEASKAAKKHRKNAKEKAKTTLSSDAYILLEKELNKESLEGKHFFNNVTRYWNHILSPIKEELKVYSDRIQTLTLERKSKSNALQQYIAEQYQFLNIKKELKNLAQLFGQDVLQNLPAGTGECAAPKLLQYAFANDLKPIAMAEFWWGKSPNKEIRKHKQFYPACQGKCKPILKHMLTGIDMDMNPLLTNPAIGKELEIIFEDEQCMVIYKPEEFLSVPGIHIKDSVYTRIKQEIKNISGPIIIHRLDMATSGLLVIAKNKEAHKNIQSQFIKKTVTKRYTAVLDGIVKEDKGTISLPLRVDLDDRPRQLVCYEHGKPAKTNWEVIERSNGKTKVYFYPISGRTHQLRMHASHSSGLNCPIMGDDLYGTKADRLYLHSDTLAFNHPITKERLHFHKEADF